MGRAGWSILLGWIEMCRRCSDLLVFEGCLIWVEAHYSYQIKTRKSPVLSGFSCVSVNNLVQQCLLYCTLEGMKSICTLTKGFNGLENDCRFEHEAFHYI